jgi:catechol 2,3-dioxygenase-like lactoylglutathione lyase family enzyme
MPSSPEKVQYRRMDVLSSRILLHPADLARSRAFYRDILGLAVYREFGDPADPAVALFTGGGLLELSYGGRPTTDTSAALWLQVRDVAAEHDRLVGAGVSITRAPRLEPWGLLEMWLADPDGRPIVLVEIPADHPLRRDTRSLPPG